MPSAMRASSLVIAIAVLAISESALAAEATCPVYKSDHLARLGVKPIAIRPLRPDVSSLPPWFFCHRPACWGTIGTEFLIGPDGVPEHIKVVSNSFPSWAQRNVDREVLVRDLIAHVRYEPMRVRGKPACTKMRMAIRFELENFELEDEQ
jgi:hypothetical protein